MRDFKYLDFVLQPQYFAACRYTDKENNQIGLIKNKKTIIDANDFPPIGKFNKNHRLFFPWIFSLCRHYYR